MSGTTSDPEARDLVRAALGMPAHAATRQPLTESGNAVFRVALADGAAVVLRVSPRPGVFGHTEANLAALRALGLPVPRFRVRGATPAGGSFVILDWLEGRDLLYELPGLEPAQLAGIAATVTDFQRRVGTLAPSRGYGWAPIGANAAAASWSEVFGAPAGAAAAPVATTPSGPLGFGSETDPQRLQRRLRAARVTLEPYFARVRPVCFLDDLTLKNLLVAHGVVAGIIDLDFACYGDPLLSVGTTLAQLAADGGEPGRHYARALLDCWHPTGDAARAVQFYAGLWTLGFLAAAEARGDAARARHLVPHVDAMLERAEG